MKSTKADEYYLAARDAVIDAVRNLDPKCKLFRTPGGITLAVTRKMPLRILLLGIRRTVPDEPGSTLFSFQRDGRVGLGGNRGVPLSQAVAAGHEPWANRGELEELAAQVRQATPVSPPARAPREGRARARVPGGSPEEANEPN